MFNDIKKKYSIEKLLRNSIMVVLCLVMGVIIAFQYKTMKRKMNNPEKSEMTVAEYQDTIIKLRDELERLEVEKNDLQAKVNTLETSTNAQRLAELERQNELLRAFAGLSETKSEGVIITVNYSDGGHVLGSSYIIQNLVNELKAAEAQAIAINGERLHAMSEVRVVNDTLVVNGNSFYSNFTFSVIGDGTKIMSAIRMSGIEKSFETYFSGDKGTFSMEYSAEVTVPALRQEVVDKLIADLTPVE